MNLSEVLTAQIIKCISYQGIYISTDDVSLTVDGTHFIFLIKNPGITSTINLSICLTDAWKGKVFNGIYGKYILDVNSLLIDSTAVNDIGETTINIKFTRF